MEYQKTIKLKDGRKCTLRNCAAKDAAQVLDVFNLTHAQTDYLLSLPEECTMTAAEEADYLMARVESPCEIEILAEIGGNVVGTAGVDPVGKHEKLKHRCSYGIGVDEAWWGLGIGRALTEACIECAKTAGYLQMELEVVADNDKAITLYRKLGFEEYGRNPKGFRSPLSGWQELVLMRLELEC